MSGYSMKRKRPDQPPHMRHITNKDYKERKCLSCGRQFMSEGPSNRRCGRCSEGEITGIRDGGGLKFRAGNKRSE